MKTGWNQETFYNIFTETEVDFYNSISFPLYLKSEYKVFGLIGWDDFILTKNSAFYRIPTVPLDEKYLEEITFDPNIELEADTRFESLIKWYIKPIVLGGSPTSEENTHWLTIDKHAEIIEWWNQKYLKIKNA